MLRVPGQQSRVPGRAGGETEQAPAASLRDGRRNRARDKEARSDGRAEA